jgi:uncharacterized protein (DUF302 family)
MTFKFARAFALVFLILPVAAKAAGHASENGIVTLESAHSVAETVDRLAAAVEGAGAKVFARVDHAAGAESVGEALRPTQMLMFGNPKLGTPALQASQTIGMDLPLRVVVWEDEAGIVHLSYTDPAAIAERHGIAADHPVISAMAGALGKVTGKAVGE